MKKIKKHCVKCAKETAHKILESSWVSESFRLALLECQDCGEVDQKIIKKEYCEEVEYETVPA